MEDQIVSNDFTPSADAGGKVDEFGNPQEVPSQEPEFSLKPDSSEEQHQTRVGRFGTFLNLTNNVLGAGIISVPSTFKFSGVGPTIILLLLSSFLNFFGATVYIRLQYKTKAKGLDTMVENSFGKVGLMTNGVLLTIFSFSCTVTYLIVGAQSVQSFGNLAGMKLNSDWKWYLIVLVYSCIVVPLTFPRKLTALSKIASASFFSVLLYFFVITIKSIIALNKDGLGPEVVGFKFNEGILTAFSVHVLTFALPIVVLPITSAYNPSPKKRITVLGWALMFCFTMVLIPSLLAYSFKGKDVESNILQSFGDDDVAILIVRIAMLVCVTCSYPSFISTMMATLGKMAFGQNIPEYLTFTQRAILLSCLNAANIVVAMFFRNITTVLSIIPLAKKP